MILSPAERSYLYDSLAQSPPIRPDGRKEFQFRPVEATTAFLPSSNGSARIRMADGSECLVSVKAKVVMIAKEPNLIECDVDVSGFRDDSNYVSDLKFNMTDLFIQNFPTSHLHLTSKYTYKLFIDCIVVSHHSHPSTLLTMTAYLALKSTRLPLLVSDVDDAEIEEQPTFSDDWDQAQLLSKVFKMDEFHPPIFITVGVVGNNLVLDPSSEEEQVLENGLLVAWYANMVITPILNMNLATNSNSANFKGLNARVLPKVIVLCKKYCSSVVNALDALLEHEGEGAIF